MSQPNPPAVSTATAAEPPYYAVILSSQLAVLDPAYAQMGRRMVALASQQPGFLGFESAHGADGFGLAVSYWASLEAIAAWRADSEHRAAQDAGKSRWFAHYTVRVARVERCYAGHSGTPDLRSPL